MEQEFSFDDFMMKALLNERYENTKRHVLDCPESTGHHSTPDKHGRCSWCGRKIAGKAMRPPAEPELKSDLELAYEYSYDPDFGNKYVDKWPS